MAIWPFSRKKRKANKEKEKDKDKEKEKHAETEHIPPPPPPPAAPSTPPPPSTPPTAPSSSSPPPIFHIADLQKSPSSSRRKGYPNREDGSPWSIRKYRHRHDQTSSERLGSSLHDLVRSPSPEDNDIMMGEGPVHKRNRGDDDSKDHYKHQSSNHKIYHRRSQNDLPTATSRSSTPSSVNHPHKRNVLRKQIRVHSDGSQANSQYPTLSRASTSSGYAHRYQITNINQRMRDLHSPIERPLSELSMAPEDSFATSLPSHSKLRALKVRSLDVLAPRPNLRFKDGEFSTWTAQLASREQNRSSLERSGSKRGRTQSPQPWRNELSAVPPYELKKNRVYGLAEEMDSRDIREALERDKKRREKKIEEQAARAQAKLEQRAAKQRAEELAAKAFSDAKLSSDSPTTPTRYRGAFEEEGTPAGSPSARKDGTNTPMSWLRDPSRENVAREVKQAAAVAATTSSPNSPKVKPNLSIPSSRDHSGLPSPDTDQDEEIVVQTAKAIRLSVCSTSPPPSPTIVRSPTLPTLVHHTRSRENSRDLETEVARRERDKFRQSKPEEGGREASWTSFFKKAAVSRGQNGHNTSHFRTSSEDVSVGKNLSGNGKTFLDSPTNDSRADSISPISRQLFTPEHSASSLPSNDVDDSSLRTGTPNQTYPERMAATARANRLTPASSHRHSADARIPIPGATSRGGSTRFDSPSSNLMRQSEDIYEASSSRSSLVNEKGLGDGAPRSLASIDSEGSWLRGRLTSPQSFAPHSPLRNSAASLRHRYKEVEGHEDKRASIADDDFFTGVPDTADSEVDEDEHAILADFVDDDDDESLASPVENEVGGLQAPNDRGKWRESLARKPTIMRVESGKVGAQEKTIKIYGPDRTYSGSSGEGDEDNGQGSLDKATMMPIQGELVVDVEEEAKRRERNSASPTLGRESPTIVHSPEIS